MGYNCNVLRCQTKILPQLLSFVFVQATIRWKDCAPLPTKLVNGKTIVINGKVYCGGGGTQTDDDQYNVYCYDLSHDKWTALPPLPVRRFGLGHIDNMIVAVGGMKKTDQEETNDVYTYDEQAQKWQQTLPHMPTARYSSSILSLQSALIAAGGYKSSSFTASVEIFKLDTLLWYRTDSLPIARQNVSLILTGKMCYALGGWSGSRLDQAVSASVDDLLGNAVHIPANETNDSSGSSSNAQSAWKTLPNTPTFGPAAAIIAGNLLAIGGDETSGGRGADMKGVYMYSPSTKTWIHISDLPAPRSLAAIAILSSTDILVIGGYFGGKVNTVYKGTLHLHCK